MFYLQSVKESYCVDNRYHVVAIVQSCNDKEPLKNAFLAELLELSVDYPENLYRFNIQEAKNKLLGSFVIKSAEIKKIKPGTLYINYSLRQPIAYISEYQNTAIDEEGVLIPFKPFYTPKNIPSLILGLSDENFHWGMVLEGEKIELAFSLLKQASSRYLQEGSFIKHIDVANAFASNLGQREIVIALEEKIQILSDGIASAAFSSRLLRLDPRCYLEQLSNYLSLKHHPSLDAVIKGNEQISNEHPAPLIIDMRIPQLAFISQD